MTTSSVTCTWPASAAEPTSCRVSRWAIRPPPCGAASCRRAASAWRSRSSTTRAGRSGGGKASWSAPGPFPACRSHSGTTPMEPGARAAYFEVYAGVWRHGDWARLTEHDGLVILGRSDATLNPGGVRIGTAEIYRQVEAAAGSGREPGGGPELGGRRANRAVRATASGSSTPWTSPCASASAGAFRGFRQPPPRAAQDLAGS